MYLWHKEDYEFQGNKWNEQLGDRQVIMHDNTNITMPQLADADKQRSLWRNYYSECCEKGPIYIFTGGIDDTDYINKSKIPKQQQQFQQTDITSTNNNFIDIFDKGYCVTMKNQKNNQRYMQPIFQKYDQKFQQNEILLSSSIATIWSRNE